MLTLFLSQQSVVLLSLSVQSFLNSATILTIPINNNNTVLQLKQAINAAEGTPVPIMDLYYNDIPLVDGDTLSSYEIGTGSYIKTSNNLIDSTLWTKENRQVYKLTLAQLRRRAAGNTSAPYYRVNNTYDINLLPSKYIGNTVVPNPHPTGLIEGRPWIPTSPAGYILQENGDYILLEDGSGKILMET